MEYYLNEIREVESRQHQSKNAGGKARADVSAILEAKGAIPCNISVDVMKRKAASKMQKLLWHWNAVANISRSVRQICTGDTLYVQFPIISHSIFTGKLFHQLTLRGVRLVLIIHDLDSLRYAKELDNAAKLRYRVEEIQAMKYCNHIIVHNEIMKHLLIAYGIEEKKLVSLGLFDYLLSEDVPFEQIVFQRGDNILIAGNLSREKSAYIHSLPENIGWNLYGVGYDGGEHQNVLYKGSYYPEELPLHLEGSFGLVWDGQSADSCTGTMGEYLRINNPHKLSLYLASGLPVIIWKEAALASFVEKECVGITVSSLYEIRDAVKCLTDEQYETMKANARRIGIRLREGYYLKRAIGSL